MLPMHSENPEAPAAPLHFNFATDVIDRWAQERPEAPALWYVNAATGADPNYHPLDGQGQDLSGANVSQAFGVGGFMNCGKSGGGEDASVAKDFLPDLKQRQIGVVTNSAGGGGNAVGVTVLITAVGGPDTTYKPLGVQDKNPWRYISSNPTNNPGSYDLWVLLSIGATTNLNTHTYGPLYLICNWSKSVQVVNSPVP